MKDLVLAAADLQSFCEEQGLNFCIIGGLALQVHGEPRLTLDVDLTVLAEFLDEERYIDLFLTKYQPRITEAKPFALKNRVLLLELDGIGIDISFGVFDFEVEMISRGIYHEFLAGLELKICTAEDLIVMKSFAARDKDWLDIESVLLRQKRLDWDYITRHLTILLDLKGSPETLQELFKLRDEFYEA